MTTDVIKPFEGPAPTPENFGQAFPTIEQMISKPEKKGRNELDPTTQGNLNELRARMRANPPKPATVINFHPWELQITGPRLLRGIKIPACLPTMPYAYFHIRGYRLDWQYNEDGTLVFAPVLPIQLAAEFVREFSNEDNDGGGVVIYEGEGHPDKVGEVETYGPTGRLDTIASRGFEYDEEGNAQPVIVPVPVKRKLSDIVAETIKRRNRRYLQKVRKADRDYKLPDGRGKGLITAKDLLMAEVLFEERLIPVVPEWNLSSRLEAGLSENNCKACGEPVKSEAYKCFKCNNIIDIVEAFRDGHAIPEAKFDIATSDELDQIDEIKYEREQLRTRRTVKPDAADGEEEEVEDPEEYSDEELENATDPTNPAPRKKSKKRR